MNDHDREQLQLWFDGALDANAHEVLSRRIDQDAELRAESELLGAIHNSMRRSFAVPDLELPVAPAPKSPPAWPMFLLGAAAAAAVLLVWLQPWGAGAPPQRPDMDSNLVAARTCVGQSWVALSNQFEPLMTASCSVPSQVGPFVQTLVPDLPEPLVWRDQPGVRLQRGIDVDPELSARVLELSVQPSTRVFVFIVLAEHDPRPMLPSSSKLAIFRAERGRLVLYELTPLEEPRGIGCLLQPD